MASPCIYTQANVDAWYFNPCTEKLQGAEPQQHHENVVQPRRLQELGVLIWEIDAQEKGWQTNHHFQLIMAQRGYNYWDILTVAPGHMADYEEKIEHFFTEHLHAEEESRFVLEGSGYFDVRDEEDRWIRFRVRPGYLIVLPPGMYHRFSLDSHNFIKAIRLFKGVPHWTQHQRPADHMDARKDYLEKVLGMVVHASGPATNAVLAL